MEIIRSRPGNHIHIRAWIAAVAGVVARSLNLEFRNRIRIRHGKGAVQGSLGDAAETHVVVNRDAVLQVSVLACRASVYRHVRRALADGGGIADVGAHTRGHR